MSNTPQTLNLYQRLAKIRKAVEVIRKNKSGYGYRYVTDDEILSKITGLMERYEVSLIPGIVPGTLRVEPYTYEKTKVEKDSKQIYQETNNEVLVTADAIYTWVLDSDPTQRIEVPWGLVGQQSDASQSFGSGMTYTFRYFLLKYFNVSTVDDDPDKWRSKQREAEKIEETAVAGQLVAQIDASIKEFVATHPEMKKDVTAVVTKFVKSGNYLTIQDPVLAGKLLEEFNNFAKEKDPKYA